MAALLEKIGCVQLSTKGGSHRKLRYGDGEPFTFRYHDGADLPRGAVRKMLVQDVGLSEEEAISLFQKANRRKKS